MTHARCRLPARGRSLHRHVDPRPRRHRPRRGRGRRGVRDRRRAVAGRGRAAQPRRLDHHHRPQPGDRPAPPRVDARRPAPGALERLQQARCHDATTARARGPRRVRRRRPRRPAPADVPVLPPRAVAATRRSRSPCGCSAGSTTPEIAAGVPRARGHDGAADRPGQAQAPRQPRPVPHPARASCPTGCDAVLAAIYLIFTEGHTRDVGRRPDPRRPLGEAIRLGRVLVELMPDEPEARRAARAHAAHRRPATGAARMPTGRWSGSPTRTARGGTARSSPRATARARLPAPQPPGPVPDPGRHRRGARRRHRRRRHRLVADRRRSTTSSCRAPNPVVALNRAVAIAERDGPAIGLTALAGLERLDGYQPYHATYADLLARTGRTSEARDAYDRAIELTTNNAERRFLERQRTRLSRPTVDSHSSE